MEIKITIEDRSLKAINALAAAVEKLTVEKDKPGISIERVGVAEKEPQETKDTIESSVDEAEIRSLFKELNTKGRRDDLKAILVKYKAENISSIQPSDYEDVAKELQEMK